MRKRLSRYGAGVNARSLSIFVQGVSAKPLLCMLA